MTDGTKCECLKCGYKWTPRMVTPSRCPKCVTKYWRVSGRGKGVTKERAEKEPHPEEKWTKVYRDISGTLTHIAWDLIDYRTNLIIPDRRVWMGGYEDDYKAEKKEGVADNEGNTLQGMRDRLLPQRQTPEVP